MNDKTTQSQLLAPARECSDEFRRADLMSTIAARVGFDWDRPLDALDKVEEEAGELRFALESSNREQICDELGDLIFAVLNVARKAGVDLEEALKLTNDKFERRFAAIERTVDRSDRSWSEFSLDELEDVWQRAKNEERPAE